MRVTTPASKEYTATEKAIIQIEEKFDKQENGKNSYRISACIPLQNSIAKNIVRVYTEAGWDASYDPFTNTNHKSNYVYFTFKRK